MQYPKITRHGVVLAILFVATSTALSDSAPTENADAVWSLPEAVAFALEHNPDAAIVRERLAGAIADYEQARAAYSPVLSVGTSYSATDNPGQAFGWILNQRAFEPGMDFNRPGTTDNWNAHAILSWSVYDGGFREGESRAARLGGESFRAEREALRNDIAFAVTRTFFQIIQSEEVIRAIETRIQALDDAISVAEAQVARGALVEAEALHIRVDRSRAREELVRARHAVALARRSFVNLLGLSYREPILEPGNADTLIPLPPSAPSIRPELDAIRIQREAAAAAVQSAQAGRRPKVHAFGRVDHDEGWETNSSGQSWSAGIALSYDLWDGGNTSGRIRGARARLRETTELERKTALAIENEVEQARLGREEAELRRAVARESVALAEENARLARVRFGQGALLTTQLTEAEAGLTAARVRLAVAESDLAVSTAALRRALGFFPIVLEP